jgi:hypothetical protein
VNVVIYRGLANGVGLPVIEQVDRPAGGHVDQHGAAYMPAAQREIIDPEHGNGADVRVGEGAHQPQQTGAAGRQPECHGQPGTVPPSSASPIDSSIPRSSGLRRAYREVRPVICAANVRTGGSWLMHLFHIWANARGESRSPPASSSLRWAWAGSVAPLGRSSSIPGPQQQR